VIEPFQSDAALLEDIQRAKLEPGLHVWWLGQSGFLLLEQNRFVLFDPYLSETLTLKYASTPKPHTRMTRRCIAPEQLDFVQVVTSSHAHTDHLDPGTLEPLAKVNPGLLMVAPEAISALVKEQSTLPDSSIHAMNAGESISVNNLEFHAIPSAHNDLETDEFGRHKFLGFILKIGPWTVYHSGDTLLYDGLEDTLKHFKPNLMFLPINGNDPSRGVAGNLNGFEAAQLAHAVGAGLVAPHHFEMFEFNTASPQEFVLECERLGQPYKVLRCGERLTLPQP
jgi:L-ascorbate metabolism protein UlaG (beta-lactamase superfamily)